MARSDSLSLLFLTLTTPASSGASSLLLQLCKTSSSDLYRLSRCFPEELFFECRPFNHARLKLTSSSSGSAMVCVCVYVSKRRSQESPSYIIKQWVQSSSSAVQSSLDPFIRGALMVAPICCPTIT